MLFNIESDTGTRIVGYLVPDAFSTVPSIRISSGGKDVLTLSTNEVREALVGAGRHETGLCGFSIDTTLLPSLADMADLTIFEADTGVMVYRRPRPSDIQRKILRLETHLVPLWRLDNALEPFFQYYSGRVENHGRESVTQMFLLNEVNSTYLSGRILFRTYASYIESGFETILLVQDPYEELAERLLVLSDIERMGGPLLGWRDKVELRAVGSFAKAVVSEDKRGISGVQLKRILRQMPIDVAATLASPLVRLLTCSTPDAMPTKGAVATALDFLASAALVGLRHESDKFVAAVGQLLNVDLEVLPAVPQFKSASILAEKLKRTGEVDALLERDIELYHYIVQASKSASNTGPEHDAANNR